MRLIDLDNDRVRHLLCNLDRKAVPGRELNNEGWFEELGGFIEELLEIADEEPIDSVSVVRCETGKCCDDHEVCCCLECVEYIYCRKACEWDGVKKDETGIQETGN